MTDKTTEALKLAEQDKQEPVVNLFDVKKKAFEQLRLEVKAPEDKWTVGDSINFFGFYSHGFEAGIKYAAPVDAKAIRSEALEEAAKVCEQGTGDAIQTETLKLLLQERGRIASVIRGLKLRGLK